LSAPLLLAPKRRGWGRWRNPRRHHLLSAALLTAGVVVFGLVAPADVRAALWRGATANPVLLILPAFFSLVALSLLWSAGQAVDSWVFLTFNLRGARPAWLDWAMLALTQLGSGYVMPLLVLLLWRLPERALAYGVVLGSLTLWLLVELVKAIVGRARPAARHSQARIVGFRQLGRSFPSGHTSQIFFLITLFSHHYHLGNWAAAGLYLLAGAVGITRLYVGAHYPRDVLAGAALGTLWGLLGGVVDFRLLGGIR
jgi:membrane-associated phospholipid phosphatase